MTDDGTIRSYLRLHLADGIGPTLFARMVERFGTAREAIAAGPAGWAKVEGIGPKAVEAVQAVTDEHVDEELASAAERGVSILCDCDEAYPPGLANIASRPPVLYVRGRIEPSDAVAVAIVGARRCTHYGLEQAARFGELLGQAGFTVVSGGARGIDTAAHRGALTASGRTIAVMGCGLGMHYPNENSELFERIADRNGALLSELPMATGVVGRNFPRRNRIISGLSLGVLVIEAARRSGALITATEAAEQGREVLALPGRVDSPTSAGTNALIRDGAALVSGLDDLLDHLGQVGAKMRIADQPADVLPLPEGLTSAEAELAEALRHGSLSVDEISRRTGLASAEAISAMTMLVLKGAVVQRPGNVFAIKTRRSD